MATAKGFFSSAYSLFTPKVHVANAPAPAPAAAPVAAPTPAPDPMDTMAALWKNDPNKPQPVDPLRGPILNPDTAKIAEAASKMDMLQGVPPELMARVQAGNDPTAIAELINTVAQRTLSTATQISAATTEQGLQRNNQRIEQALPDRIKQVQLASITVDNKALAHPASQPMLQMVRQQIAAQNPHLSPQAINQQAEALLVQHANAVAGVDDVGFRDGGIPRTQQNGGGKETDWETWAGV